MATTTQLEQVRQNHRANTARATQPAPADRTTVQQGSLPSGLPSALPTWRFFGDEQCDESQPIEPTTLPQPQHIEAVRILAYISHAWHLKDAETAGLLGVETSEWQSLYRIMLLVPPRPANRSPNRYRGPASRYRGHRMADPAFGEYDANSIFHDVLSEEHLGRISDIGAIYRALQLRNMEYFEPDWLFQRNTAKVFDGKSPLKAMIEGGTAKIQEVRKYLGD